MVYSAKSYSIDGTSALMNQQCEHRKQATIIPIEALKQRASETPDCPVNELASEKSMTTAGIAASIKDVLYRSEMWCSLAYEGISGCPFNAFSRKAVGALASSATFVGIMALVFGA